MPVHGVVSRVVLSATMVGLLGSCAGSDTSPLSAAPSATARDASRSPNATTSEAPASIDLIANPSIDDRFAVADDGRELALVCWGDGTPTVLLETGGPNIEEWRNSGVVHELVGTNRVCTYDRAGTGQSDPPPNEKRDADDVVAELNALLIAADIDGPYVLLGRSFGGMIVTHYAETSPEGVVGVIVLDTPAPSAEFTEENEPEMVWDYPGNTERLDVVGGFENRFANDPPGFDVPLLIMTPVPGESTPDDQSFWLQVSPKSRQVELSCGQEPTEGACARAVLEFVEGLD